MLFFRGNENVLNVPLLRFFSFRYIILEDAPNFIQLSRYGI